MASNKGTGKRLAATLLVVGALGATSLPAAASKPVDECPRPQLVRLVATERNVETETLRVIERVQDAELAARIVRIEAIHRGREPERAPSVAIVDHNRFFDREMDSVEAVVWDVELRDVFNDDNDAPDTMTGAFVDVVVGGARLAARAGRVADHLAVAAAKITTRALHSLL